MYSRYGFFRPIYLEPYYNLSPMGVGNYLLILNYLVNLEMLRWRLALSPGLLLMNNLLSRAEQELVYPEAPRPV